MEQSPTYPAIEVRNLTKIYRLHQSSLRNQLSVEERQRIVGDDFYALNDVSFNIEKGQVVGIVGSNGSGKTTLMQILCNVSKPTSGQAFIDGTVSAILDVDSGFHPDLSGRENIYLRGAIMGMKRSEVDRKFDEIVDFSEIRPFIDEPVKAYSNGMFVRLAFSVAAHLDSDIVLIDEVISVGDADFRAKSFDKIRALAASGKTVVIISHELNSVVEICQSAILIKDGRIKAIGGSKQIVGEYLQDVVLSKQGKEDVVLMNKLRAQVNLSNGRVEEMKERIASTEDVATRSQLETELEVLVASRKEVSDKLNGLLRKQNEDKKLPSSLSWKPNEAPGSTDVRLLSISCQGKDSGTSSVTQLEAIEVEITYEKLTTEPSLPTILLTYQMSNMAFGGNPLYSKVQGGSKFDTAIGVHTWKCIIPARTLNAGIFTVGLMFVDTYGEELSQHPDLVYFKVDYHQKMFDDHLYNGRFPGPSFLEMDWSLESAPSETT